MLMEAEAAVLMVVVDAPVIRSDMREKLKWYGGRARPQNLGRGET